MREFPRGISVRQWGRLWATYSRTLDSVKEDRMSDDFMKPTEQLLDMYEKLGVPHFQRGLVWSAQQARDRRWV